MRPIRREDILDLSVYERSRDEIRRGVLEAKAARRVQLAGALTFLFENAATVRYQVQEMLRAERIVRDEEVRREIDTYNELLGARGALGVTLLIELPDPEERDRRLREWLALPEHLYVTLESDEKVRATYDPRQVGADRLSSVQYLKFDVKGRVPVAIGCDLPGLESEVALGDAQRYALRQDLASDA